MPVINSLIRILNICKTKCRKIIIPILQKRFSKLSNQQIFSKIYKEKLWSKDKNVSVDFYSGPGSHDPDVVDQYVDCILNFFKSQNNELKVLDVGCGDFNIGRKLFKHTKQYIAVDVVEELIERNKKSFISENLNFHTIDIVHEKLPNANCILLKEVLQHLTNKEIIKILQKINRYKYVVITENIPINNFIENLDKVKGPHSRSYLNSGVLVEKPPFNFKFSKKKVLLRLERSEKNYYLITTLYTN